MENKSLGKGLSALIPEKSAVESGDGKSASAVFVKTALVRDNSLQPRINYDEAKIADLKESIQDKGMLQPVLVRPSGDGYEVVAGERRLRAARAANIDEIPVIIKDVDNQEALVLALIENLQREDLNAIEEGLAYKNLVDNFKMTQSKVAQAVGKDESTIVNTLRLLRLPQSIQQAVIKGAISMGHARALLSIEDPGEQKKFFHRIIEQGLSVREIENLTRTEVVSNPRRGKTRKKEPNHELVALEEEIQQILGTKVRIQAQLKRGKLIVEYYSLDDLERIINIIRKKE